MPTLEKIFTKKNLLALWMFIVIIMFTVNFYILYKFETEIQYLHETMHNLNLTIQRLESENLVLKLKNTTEHNDLIAHNDMLQWNLKVAVGVVVGVSVVVLVVFGLGYYDNLPDIFDLSDSEEE